MIMGKAVLAFLHVAHLLVQPPCPVLQLGV